MPTMRHCSLYDVICKQVTSCKVYVCLLFYLYFCTSNSRKQWIEICDKHIMTWGFGLSPQYQPLTVISPWAKALGLIMGLMMLQAITKPPWNNLLLLYMQAVTAQTSLQSSFLKWIQVYYIFYFMRTYCEYQNLSRRFEYFVVHWHYLNAHALQTICDKMINMYLCEYPSNLKTMEHHTEVMLFWCHDATGRRLTLTYQCPS